MKEPLKYKSIIIVDFFAGVVISPQFLQVLDDFTAPVQPDLEKLLAHPSWDLLSMSLWMFLFPYCGFQWQLEIITLHPNGDVTL